MAEKERDSDLNSDQDKAKDCNGQVVPKVVLERSATVIGVRARFCLCHPLRVPTPINPGGGDRLVPSLLWVGSYKPFCGPPVVPMLHPKVSPDHALLLPALSLGALNNLQCSAFIPCGFLSF